MELEYINKKCVYYAGCYHDRLQAAIVRTLDGRLQHLQGGQLKYEISGLGHDASPMALTGDGRVLLVATSKGSVISVGWPKDPEEAGHHRTPQLKKLAQQQQQQYNGPASPVMRKQGNLSVQVGAALGSPTGESNSAVAPGGMARPAARGRQSPRTPFGDSADSAAHQQQQRGPIDSIDPTRPVTPTSPPKAGTGPPGSPGAGSFASSGVSDGAATAGCGAVGGEASVPGMKEYRLHGARITAIKVLHSAGVMFTASADGLVMMSSLSMVLGGILSEPPLLTLPPSAVATGSTAAALAATAALGLGASGLLPGTTVVAGGNGAVPAGAVPGLPFPIVLVDEGLLVVLKERLHAMAVQVAAIQKEAQYQVLRQTQALKESLTACEAHVAALQQEVAQLKQQLADSHVAADEGQQQVVKELESLHIAAAEQLEGLYEARLALEMEKLNQLQAAKDDMEFSFKEEMKRQAMAAERQLAEVYSTHRQQLCAEIAKSDGVAAAAAEAESVWHEVLLQTEEDLEAQAERDSERLASAQLAAGERDMKLKAEISILLRSNNRLKADKAVDTGRIDALTSQTGSLQQQLVEAAAVADKLRGELAERDAVIGDNYATMQGLRTRVQELETHKFVLGYKAETAASQLQPKEEQLAAMQDQLQAQERELLAGRSALLVAQRTVRNKSTAASVASQELWEARQTLARQAGMLEAVAHDILHVMQQPDEMKAGRKTARQQALEALVVKYCTTRGGGPCSSEQVEAEIKAHIVAAEKKSSLLQNELRQALESNRRTGRRLMTDNTALLADLAELQHSNRDLVKQLAAATEQLEGFGAWVAAMAPATNAAGPSSNSSSSPVLKTESSATGQAGLLQARAGATADDSAVSSTSSPQPGSQRAVSPWWALASTHAHSLAGL
eukprot:GHRR01003044.1.p1 GENE.GHRR01003044.1~~GHRR01003044.1.p1  ORF type:complete len:947 (+),score=451.86 GHRR01003044.1:130-2841(+)